ncbi:heme/hemin ABC transporter substrate-binding protein [Serratia plymuthica]|jgi:iron complex transport system substrate-binding protein|uniref:heme/hemin ABC transporter substrate-binding protein n=1 Tax=Serratia plymuthica TaxID=82996 RepID=UPI0019289D41|nr:hemin ABC transporter substrate-binding protein [Serratia plymuthica]MBL3521825.1 hemin ABC transporter substrate-binding protein [Serratia plymuthica]
MKSWVIGLLALPFSVFAGERVIAIGGDVTEIIYALGAGQTLVARDSTSQQPPQATALPNVGYMRQLNAEGILALKPSLVIASELAQPSLALQQVEQAGVKVVMVTGKPELGAIDEKIAVIAATLGREKEGKALQVKLDRQIAAVPTHRLPVRVLFIMAHTGIAAMGAGNGTAAEGAIRSAGLDNALAGVTRYQPLTQEGLVAAAPQLLVIGKASLQRMGGEANLWALPGLAFTPAGKQRQLLVIDDNALLSFGLDMPTAIGQLRQAAEAVAP